MKALAPALLCLGLAAAEPAGTGWKTYEPQPVERHPEWDAEYTRQIRAATTGPQFLTELVDHLPASATVPTPLKHLGYIAGAPGRLSYAAEVHAYLRALEKASRRVKVFRVGTSEEGREMIAAAIADEAVLADLPKHKETTRRLADPRGLDEREAARLIQTGRPVYYLTGAMHSPETGSPEMLMELAYRLAVEETPRIRAIRANVITLITPVLEVDGRERQVDLIRDHLETGKPLVPLAYWGKYVAHDNNRDQIGLTLALSRNVLGVFLDWHPQVVHDLHESVPFLYISTGTGPYNAWLDPLMIGEYTRMANQEVQELTRMGLPGVWTHGFYDGWAPNYLFWAGMGHNAIGRFYETFGNRVPTTEARVVREASTRQWYRQNPPLPQVSWSLRNNVNYQQSGVLLALSDMAARREHFLRQFWELGRRAVAKARTEGPAAYVLDGGQKRQGQLRDAMQLLRRHGIEVHVAEKAFSLDPQWPPRAKGKDEKAPAFPAGSLVVRMDQPYSRLADALLDVQFVRGDERVYDDTGWTLGLARNLECRRVVNPAVLDVPMRLWNGAPEQVVDLGRARALAIEHAADTDLLRLAFALPKARLLAAEPGKGGSATVYLELDDRNRNEASKALARLSLKADPVAALPDGNLRELRRPRLALLHSWAFTQTEGWYRLALEELGIPYTYLSTQAIGREPDLRTKYDVILFPPAGRGAPQDLVNGYPPGPPLPWRKSAATPNLGPDETDDLRPGLGLEGVERLRRFVADGGLLITVQDTAAWAVHYGLARWVRTIETPRLKAPGSLLQAKVQSGAGPVAFGYDDGLPVFFANGPAFAVGAPSREPAGARVSGRGGKDDPDVPQGRPYVGLPERAKPAPEEEGFQPPEDMPKASEALRPRPEDRPRVLLSYVKEADKLLLSGMLDGAEELAGKPALIASPHGRGAVLLFTFNPMWRMTTQGAWSLVGNALLHWDRVMEKR